MPDEFDIFSSHDRETESFECTTPKANKRQRKYRIHQVAKDFELRTKDIIDILTRNNVPVKNHMQILNRHELDIIFNTLISRSTNSISNSQKEPCAIYQSEQQFCEAQQMNKTTIIKCLLNNFQFSLRHPNSQQRRKNLQKDALNLAEIQHEGVNPKFCVNSISGANRAKFICGGSRLVRLPPW